MSAGIGFLPLYPLIHIHGDNRGPQRAAAAGAGLVLLFRGVQRRERRARERRPPLPVQHAEFVRAFRERRQVRRQRGITGSPVRPRRPRPVGRRLQPVAQPRSPPARRAANADEIRALVAAGAEPAGRFG